MEEKKKFGRPPKYDNTKHPKEYVELSALGKTKAQICAHWSIAKDTLVDWSHNHPDFSVAIKIGDQKRQDWWIEFAKNEEGANKMHPTLFVWVTKNTLGWTDKLETKNHTQLDAKVEFTDKTDNELMNTVIELELLKAKK